MSTDPYIPRYLLFYRDGRTVRAADASPLLETADITYPSELAFDGKHYRVLTGDSTFFFWDELRDSSNRTAGFIFSVDEDPRLLGSSFLQDSNNVLVESWGEKREVTILLTDDDDPRVECVQGFDSEFFQNQADPTDCFLIMFHYSANPIAFPLETGMVVSRIR